MENEIKFVHREETFNDHAVEELADDRAMCICRLQFGRCEKSECKTCSHFMSFLACYEQMNDYDRTRLEKKVSARYTIYSRNPEGFMSYDRLKWYYAKFLLAAIACLLLALFLCAASGYAAEYKRFFSPEDIVNAPEPRMKAKHKNVGIDTETNVKHILRMTQEQVRDLNGDGWVNCIDHAVMFKLLWDKHFDNRDCMIVRNTNINIGMNHLFVSVFDWKTLSYVDVEPWTRDLNVWQMVDAWGNAYDIYYNRYDETERWLGKVKIKIR